jgi:hypothetical protein
MSKNILILLLSSHKYPSPRNEKVQNLTWVKDAQKFGIEVIQFIGGYEKQAYEKPYLKLTSRDSIEDVGYKTIESFEWAIQKKKFDYIFRVNSSSYINISKLMEYLENVPEGSLYAGNIIELEMLNLKFVSGSGIILDKDSVRNIVENKNLWDHSIIDDVALGDICANLKISPTPGEFFELQKNVFSYKELGASYHVRCKLEDYGYPRFLESVNMLNLSKIHNNMQISKLSKIFSIFIFEFIKLINLKFYVNKFIFRNRHLRNFLRKYKNKLLKNLSK